MRMQELKAMNRQALGKRLAALREQLRTLKFRIYTKEVKNNHQLRQIRKDIARILTVINQGR